MIYELGKSQFNNISHLLFGDRCNVEIKAVTELNNPGWVFVDNIKTPKTALVWSKGIEGFYFAGEENNPEFNDYINDYIDIIIRPRAKQLGLKSFECSGISQQWDNTIEKLFNKRKLQKSYQCVYKFKDFESCYLEKYPIDSNYTVRRIDCELLNSQIDNKEFLLSEIQLFWSSVEDFLQKGIGFCIMNDKLVVSRAISGFVTKNTQTIGIETLKEYRRKGFAKKSVIEFLKHCKTNKFEPYWDCMKKNIASASTAESIGFSKDFEYALYEFYFED